MTDYRTDTLATETVEWTGTNGMQIVITVSLTQEMRDPLEQGEFRPAPNGLNVTARATVGTMVMAGTYPTVFSKPNGDVVASIGRLGLTAQKLALYNEAVKKVQQHPSYQARRAAEQTAAQVDREYRAMLTECARQSV